VLVLQNPGSYFNINLQRGNKHTKELCTGTLFIGLTNILNHSIYKCSLLSF